ncbi:cadherin-like domain-containing protein [Gammaproteobacteria bacterium]|nr:cadherin-like domain-containing protein [Gammaproteobacteria bacterium]
MKNLYFISLLFIISSCGGGGGGSSTPTPAPIPFNLSIGLTSFSVDEDTSYSGSLNATANETVTLNYSITSSTSNGTLTLSADGGIFYNPNSDFFGSDQFEYSVTAVEKNVTKSATVNITVNSVNDEPEIAFTTFTDYSKDTLIYDSTQTFKVSVSDKDNQVEEITFEILIGSETISGVFVLDESTATEGDGELTFDLSALQNGGLYTAEIRASDGVNFNSISFESWFASNKRTITIQQDDDPEDGFDGGDKTSKDYEIYYLSGGPNSLAGTTYLFVGDSLSGQSDIDLYRRALIASVNKLNDSDASGFFNPDYFTILSVEPIDPDGTSPFGVRTGCYDWDEDVYCIGDMDTDIFSDFLPDYRYRDHLISTLTRIEGRGVNLGNRNIQPIRENDPERTSTTLMHELGHAHGEMGDEYRTDDDRDVSAFADLNVNTTTEPTVSLVKWNHHIEDQLNVLGQEIKVCYNTSDGRIYDRDADEYVDGLDCDCLANEWDSEGNFIRKNPECAKVGLFEGNYYGEFDNYRPTFCSIMDSCSSGGYGPVNVEGFAIGSIQNQGFYDAFDDVDIGFTSNNAGWQMTVNASYDTSKITLKWYVNGIEDTSKQNQTSVTFNRPSNNEVQIYTAKAFDLTGTIIASDDVLDNTDFYEGLFQSYFIWCADYDQAADACNDFRTEPNPSEYSDFDYGYMDGPLGFSWGINWAKW